jgi:hypothetical protein
MGNILNVSYTVDFKIMIKTKLTTTNHRHLHSNLKSTERTPKFGNLFMDTKDKEQNR